MKKQVAAFVLLAIYSIPSVAVAQITDAEMAEQPSAVRAFASGLLAGGFLGPIAHVDHLIGDFDADDIDDMIAMVWYFNQNAVDMRTLVLRGTTDGIFQYVRQAEDVFGSDPREALFETGRVTFTTSVVGPDDQRCCPSTPRKNVIEINLQR